MVRSMTGYGRGFFAIEGREITVELKSVNHRYLDLSMRLPRHIGFLEDIFRKLLSDQLSRGHIDIYINYRNCRNDNRTITLDEALIVQYMDAAKSIAEQFCVENDLKVSHIFRFPDAVSVMEAEEDREALVEIATEAMNLAIADMKRMRELEGEKLFADMMARAKTILALREQILLRAPYVVEEYRNKLLERVSQLLKEVEIDRARLATEIALFADRANIDEEITRIESHMRQFEAALASGEPSGRKLDFIVQELNREFNTIGSKANDVELTNIVLNGKAEIEKIREQVQNIE